MKIFKLDLMTVLFVVVLIGVVVTMTTQANDHALPDTGMAGMTSMDQGAVQASSRPL